LVNLKACQRNASGVGGKYMTANTIHDFQQFDITLFSKTHRLERMKYWFLKLFLVLTYMGSSLCYAQQILITSYQNIVNTELNLSLFGKVKHFKQFSNYPNTNSSDTIAYIFNDQGLPVKIVKTSRALFYPGAGEEIYDFINGNLISEKYYENNTLLFGTNLKYDKLGRLLESSKYSNRKNLKRKAGKPFFIETYQYDSSGLLTAYTMDNHSEIFKKYIYKYDNNGNKIEEGYCENYKGIKYPVECNYKALLGYEYNAKNQLTKKFGISKWSPHNTDTYYQYDEYGNEIEAKGYYITDVTVLGFHYVYQYDEYGNKIMEEQKAGHYRNIGGVNYKYTRTQYDNYQNITQQEYLTSQNKLLKIVRYIYSYDSVGNWIKKEKLEGNTEQELSKVEVDDRIIEYFQ